MIVAPTFPMDEGGERSEEDTLRVPAIQNFNGSDFSVRIALPFLLDEKIDAFAPEVIHSHHPFLLGDAGLRAARKRNLPLVFTHHTLYERYTHYVPLDSEAMKRFVIRLATEYANLCTKVIAPSRSIGRLIQSRGVAAPIEVVPTGVDVSFFKKGRAESFRREHDIPEEAPVVGHVGRLAPEKNLGYLAESVAVFLRGRDEARFVVIGGGPSSREIAQILEARGVKENLILAGRKSGRDLADAYQAMDVFVFASQTETQGLVVAEAMASGTPVIALDASGVRDVVEEDRNGRLLPGGSPPELFAEAVSDFFDDREKAQRWKTGAQETANRFSRQACAERLLEVYESAIEAHAEPSRTMSEDLDPWNRLRRRLKAEWDLMSQKAAASLESFREEEEAD